MSRLHRFPCPDFSTGIQAQNTVGESVNSRRELVFSFVLPAKGAFDFGTLLAVFDSAVKLLPNCLALSQ